MMRRSFAVTALSAVFLSVTHRAGASGDPIVLAERGKPASCSIVLPDGPGPVAQYAAEELRDWTEKLTGTRLPIVTNATPERAIYVGGTEEPDLGEDGFRLKSEGGSIRVIASAARGVLYGVYELLETYGGIGWFSSWHTVVPKCDRFTVPSDLDVRQVPAFEIRDAFFHDALYHSEFGARIRMNENLRSPKDAKYGASSFRCGKGLMAHTFGTLVPAERYFDSHPDYFSEVDGHRLRSRTQLCPTNPDVERVFAANFMAAVRRDPDARYFAVCHDDWQNWCQCPTCRAINEAEGAPAGTELRFANRMAEILERELPGRMVKFAAYDYTQRPPKSTRARHNVLVEFAPVHCDCSMPLTESPYEGNVRAAADLRGWGRLAGNLRIWDYYADFCDYQMPFPDVLSIRENLRFYRDNSVRQMFAQGNHNSAYADFSALKTWLLGKLMWNPDQPLEPLLRRFFDGFYGLAAPLARQYFDELHALPRDHVKNPLKITQTFNTPVLTDAFLDRALKLWNEAEAAVKDDPVHLRNVRLGKISVAYVILRRQGAIVSVTRTPYPTAPVRDLATWMVGALDEFGAQMQICEGKSIAEFHGHCRKLADPGRVTPPMDSVTVDAESVCRLHANFKVSVADDPAAGGDKAIRYPNLFPRVWSVQMPMENLGYDRGGRYRFLLRARIDRKPGSPDGEVIEAGISGAAVRRIRADELSGDYRWFTIAECEPKPGMTLYIAPGNYDTKKSAGNPAYDRLWVDQLEFVRIDETADRCPVPVAQLMKRASTRPSLVMTREQASVAKRRIAENADAKAWWTVFRAACEKELGRAVELPPRGGQWTHWYCCRKCATALKAKSPTEHVCPNCGELHTGWPFDDVAMGERHEGNATAIHDLGIAFLLTDDRRFARKAAEWLLAYAERYLRYPMHNTTGDYGPNNPGKGKGGHVLSQVLDECVWMIRVMQGYDCVAQTMTSDERSAVLAKFIRPSVDVMLSECAKVHNHECWHLTAFGMAGFLLGDEKLVDRAVDGPYNLYRQLQDGVYADGTWFEGAWGYHFYTIRALTPFVQSLVNLGVPPPRRLREMFHAPFGQVTSSWHLPAVHDTARMNFTPGTLAEFYEHAYSWWDDDVFGWWVNARPRRSEAFALHGRDGNPAVALPWKSDPFPAAGLAVLRSRSGREGKDDPPGNYVALDYGKHGGWHGHYDKLNLILYGNGEILGEDPGCIGYGNPRHFGWYRTTLAHNSLSVDGRHQEETEGSLIAFTNLANGAAVAVDAGQIAPGVKAGRATALSGNLVFDLVWAESESEHDWEWAFHSRGKFSMDDRGKPFELPKPEQPMLNGRPTDSDGTDALRWVRDLASRSQDGVWSARWVTDRTELNLFQRSASGVLTSGEGSAQPANRSFRLIANRVRGRSALFATVMTLDGEKSVEIGEPVAGDGGKMSFAATVGGKTYRLSVDRKARRVSFGDKSPRQNKGAPQWGGEEQR